MIFSKTLRLALRVIIQETFSINFHSNIVVRQTILVVLRYYLSNSSIYIILYINNIFVVKIGIYVI